MSSRDLIDAQFDRAVEIVQSLPKHGPIQTGYEEKLTMYSLYKQATVGNVTSPRPGIFDMLGRAKWDAWAKHKDLDSYEARWLYVDALLKVLRRYSDKTIARDYIRELESYSGDPSNLVISRSMTKTPRSTSSASDISDDHSSPTSYPAPPHLQRGGLTLTIPGQSPRDTTSEEDSDEEGHDHVSTALVSPSVYNRPQSSMSSHRYRTPMAGSLAMSPPPSFSHQGQSPAMVVPATQPHPGFENTAAFEGALSPPRSRPPSTHFPLANYQSPYQQSPGQTFPSPGTYRPPSTHQFPPPRQYNQGASILAVAQQRAIENVQAHLAALTERLEMLEALTGHPRRSTQSLASRLANSGRGSPDDGQDEFDAWNFSFNFEDMGMWSLALRPLLRVLVCLRQLSHFLAHDENRSPMLIVVRRLFLDISFVLTVLALTRLIWRKTGVRRKEVNAALVALWRAVVGAKTGPTRRIMVDRGV